MIINKLIDLEIEEKCKDINFLMKYKPYLDKREFLAIKLRLGHKDNINHTYSSIAKYLPRAQSTGDKDEKLLSISTVSKIYRRGLIKIRRVYKSIPK